MNHIPDGPPHWRRQSGSTRVRCSRPGAELFCLKLIHGSIPMSIRVGWMLGIILVVSGCATRGNLFVLVPDPEGKVGSLSVTTEAGTATLDQSREYLSIASAASAPREGKVLKEQKIEKVFGDALSAVPPRPERYLVYFQTGSSEPNAEFPKLLLEAVSEIRARDSRDVSVNGHADRTGTPQQNMTLSLERANRVADALAAEGVNPDILTVDYHGEGDPVVPTEDDVDEPRNRRVEIIVR